MSKGCFYEASYGILSQVFCDKNWIIDQKCKVIMPITHGCDKVTWKQEYYDKEV